MSTMYPERLTDQTKAPDGVPQMLFNHFVAGPGQAIADRRPDESITTALRRYLVDAWDQGCARLYDGSRDMVLVECAMPQITTGSVARQCEDMLTATLREELGSDWADGPGVQLMASQIFTAIRLVMDEMRLQILDASSLAQASSAIRTVVAEVFDQLDHGLHGIGARTAV